jgi:hypothetical protein
VQSDGTAQFASLPPLALHAARISASPNAVMLTGARGAIGRSTFAKLDAQFDIANAPRVEAAKGDFDVALDELHAWLRARAETAHAIENLSSVSGRAELTLNRLSGRLDAPASFDYDFSVQPHAVNVRVNELPGPLGIANGAIRADKRTLRFDGVGLAMLDGKAMVTGSVEDYSAERWHAKGAIGQGMLGSAIVEWIWRRTGAPPRLRPKAPLRLDAQQVGWGPYRPLDARAALKFPAGQLLTLEVNRTADVLDIRRATIQDQHSNAVVSLLARKRVLQGRFSGKLSGPTIAAMLESGGNYTGYASGDLTFTSDREQPRHTTAKGALEAQAVDLSWLVGEPLYAERIDLTADGSALQIREATVSWREQPAKISGRIEYGGDIPVIDAQIDSTGILVNALLGTSEKAPATHDSDTKDQNASAWSPLARIWPLPFTGHIKVASGFIEYDHYRAAPVRATLTLEPDHAQLDVQEAKLCGLSLPLSVQATPQTLTAVVHIAAHAQKMEDSFACLTGERAVFTGDFDLRADLKTVGPRPRLPEDLEGTVHLEARDGTVKKFDVLRGILALNSIARLFERVPKVGEDQLPYRKFAIEGRFQAKHFIVEEFAFDSAALGLSATGTVGLAAPDTNVVMLVAPFTRTTRLVRAIPAIGYIIGGTFTTVPVSITGDWREPTIVPLGPEAITSQLTGIFARTLKLPGKMLSPLTGTPKQGTAQQP